MVQTRRMLLAGSLFACAAAAPAKMQKRDALPSFATTYAPYAYLASAESYWPSEITTHLQNCIPEINFTAIGAEGSATLDNLSTYNSSVYMTGADDAFEKTPAWVVSAYGQPDNSTGYSAAPGLIIGVDLNSTTTDIYYMYFYSYNYGGK